MRDQKGKSIISFPENYTVVDIETTGFSPQWDEIIELAAIKCKNGVPCAEYNTLLQIDTKLDPFIVSLTGITDDMLTNAPRLSEKIEEFVDFIGSDIVVGNNVSFDINFIYDACLRYVGKPFTNDYINTVRFANKLLPGLPSKRLTCICDSLGIPTAGAHRALCDCKLTNQVYLQFVSSISDRDAFVSQFSKKTKKKHTKSLRVSEILADPDFVPDENSEIYGKSFCFTGKLDQMIRQEACQIVVNMGGSLTSTVTKKTDFLVLGSTDYCKTIKEGKTQKQKKADDLLNKGFDIKVISEDVFYQMIED